MDVECKCRELTWRAKPKLPLFGLTPWSKSHRTPSRSPSDISLRRVSTSLSKNRAPCSRRNWTRPSRPFPYAVERAEPPMWLVWLTSAPFSNRIGNTPSSPQSMAFSTRLHPGMLSLTFTPLLSRRSTTAEFFGRMAYCSTKPSRPGGPLMSAPNSRSVLTTSTMLSCAASCSGVQTSRASTRSRLTPFWTTYRMMGIMRSLRVIPSLFSNDSAHMIQLVVSLLVSPTDQNKMGKKRTRWGDGETDARSTHALTAPL